MTPTHSGIDFGWIAGRAFRRRLLAAAAVVVVAAGTVMLLIAPVSSTTCESLVTATQGPDLRVTALPGVDLRPVLGLSGLSAASGPYSGVASSMQRGGTEISTWIEGRPAHHSAVDRPFIVSGSWTRRGGVVVEQGLARRLGVRTGGRVRVATAGGTIGLRVGGIAATSSVRRARGISGLAYVLPRDLRRIAPAPVRGSSVLLRTAGHDSAPYAAWLARRYPGPQAAIARNFANRCVPR
jgi:hypothetical protein